MPALQKRAQETHRILVELLKKVYDIPLRCLLPKNTDHLIVAGRCISGTHEAHSPYRVMPIVIATGQAAGVCTAIASREGTRPRKRRSARGAARAAAAGDELAQGARGRSGAQCRGQVA